MESETDKVPTTSVTDKSNEANLNNSHTTDLIEVKSDRTEWLETVKPIADSLNELPAAFSKFFSDYRNILGVLGYGTLALISVYISLAVIDAIEDIPILPRFFELIGLGYVLWISWNLLEASKRKDLWANIESLKESMMGKKPE